MSNKMQVTMKLDQRLMMSQQLRQAITLLQYNTLDLKQLIQTYLETNPLLELDEEKMAEQIDDSPEVDASQSHHLSADFTVSRQYHEDESSLENYAIPVTLQDHLLEQTLLCQFNEVEQDLAERIVGSINDDGYLALSLEEIQSSASAAGFETTLAQVKSILKKIQSFDPLGVGSRDVQECLLLQLDFMTQRDDNWKLARSIISDNIEFLATSNVKKLVKKLNITPEAYEQAMDLIRTLNPHPGVQFATDINIHVEPELYVKKVKKQWKVFLSDSILTNVKINDYYQELIKKNKKNGSYHSLRQELEEARGLLGGLKRRNETLFAVGSYIVDLQSEFLEHGQTHMKSLNIVDVSQALNMHESTVSRITTGKYIKTPRGIFELKYFFPSHVTTKTGDTCSAVAVKALIKEIIDQEGNGHVYSDEEVAGLLKQKGINISRRTVAKYREAMKILPSYQRTRMQSCAEPVD